jgi:hypothetical protein
MLADYRKVRAKEKREGMLANYLVVDADTGAFLRGFDYGDGTDIFRAKSFAEGFNFAMGYMEGAAKANKRMAGHA